MIPLSLVASQTSTTSAGKRGEGAYSTLTCNHVRVHVNTCIPSILCTSTCACRSVSHFVYTPYYSHFPVSVFSYLGGLRLLQATCKKFYQYCAQHGLVWSIKLDLSPLRVEFERVLIHMRSTYTPRGDRGLA